MNMQRHVAAIAVLSLFAALALELYKGPTFQFPVAGGVVLGSALAFLGLSLGIAAVPGSIYWMMKRRLMPGFPQVAWVMWVLLVGSASYATYFEETSPRFPSSTTTYIPERCEYLVELPGTPEITTLEIQGIGELSRAEYFGDSAERDVFLRVECINLPKVQRDLLDDKQVLISKSAAFAKANGLTGVEFHYEDTELGQLVTVRGFKTVAEKPATYEIHQYLGSRSLLIMYAGGVSSHYPQLGVAEFFGSVAIVGAE